MNPGANTNRIKQCGKLAYLPVLLKPAPKGNYSEEMGNEMFLLNAATTCIV
jgi:hypothetical protein